MESECTMSKKILTSEAGAPIERDDRSLTAGPGGPVLLQDHHLIEKLAHFHRERIPERVVHAVGSAAYGTFTVTNGDLAKYTKMKLLSELGKKTDVFLRFSTVAGSRGAADLARDPRGFAVKFYTEEGNWDLVGNNTPIFFLRDGIKFPDFIHSQKYDPHTNKQEPNNVWDFFSRTPEATHQFLWLFGDRGIPASYAAMDGFGSHTFQWVNAAGERSWVKFHFKTERGIETFDSATAAKLAGENPQYLREELYTSIREGRFPAWTVSVQIMPEAAAKTYRYNPFDLTKVWPHSDYPRLEIGRLVLDRLPGNYFAEVEQSAFDPGHFVPGIGPSPDRMLQARLYSYGDAHRYRLGINHLELPVNRPHNATATYTRDGFARHGFGAADGKGPNYFPNHAGALSQTGEEYPFDFDAGGPVGCFEVPKHAEDNDFVQAGALYRLMQEEEKQRLVANLAGSLKGVTLEGVVAASVAHFRAADADLGARLDAALAR
jgi:catalase